MKRSRKYVCPDRMREGSIRRKADVCSYQPPMKKHCRECLNTNLVAVEEIQESVGQLLSSTCDQCGLLWVDIEENSKEAHCDRDMKIACARVSARLNARDKSKKLSQQQIENIAFKIYCEDYPESGSVKKFKKLKDTKKGIYLARARAIVDVDMSMLMGTFMEHKKNDDRPSADFSSIGSCLFPKKNDGFKFIEMTKTYGTLSYMTNFLKKEKIPHVTYQMCPQLSTENWGTDCYVCYVCTEEINFDFKSENGPVGINCKVCSCSAHVTGTYPCADLPPVYTPPLSDAVLEQASAIKVCLPKEIPRQTAVNTNNFNKDKFLYFCNSMFSGYVIHSGCCSVSGCDK